MSETSEVTWPLIRALNGLPWCHAHRIHCGARGGMKHNPAGWPDIGCVYRGEALYFETKARDGRLSPGQKACIARLRRAGAVVHVVASVAEGLAVIRGRDLWMRVP